MAKKLNHEHLLKQFKSAYDYYNEDYKRNKDDADFALGDQWPEQIKGARENDGRPVLTENRMLPFIMQVVNDIRQARPQVQVKPVDGGADKVIADVLGGMIRNIQNVNEAETIYDTAAYNSVSAGYGWVRIGTDYADPLSFDQEITMSRIVNPFSVIVDPNSTSVDASDAEYIYVYTDVSKEDFEAEYPNEELSSFEVNVDEMGQWKDEHSIRVAEYFYKDYEKKTLVEYVSYVSGVAVPGKGFKDEMPEDAEIIRERKVQVPVVKYCKLNGKTILEENTFPSQYIPIVPVYGLETWFKGRRHIFTLIHQAKDSQRMLNYWKTSSAEIIALQPKAPWVVADGQIKGYENIWQSANRVNHSVLPYKPLTVDGFAVPAPQRQMPPTNSGSMMQEAAAAADAIRASLGMQDTRFNEQRGVESMSGKAIIASQMQGENSTFHFVDNLAASMRQVGRILVDMIPKVYSEQRMVRILGEDGQDKQVPINQPVVREGGEFRKAQQGDAMDKIQSMALGQGKYDVVVEVGPSYATKRQELVNNIIELARIDPRIMEVAGDMMIQNMDFPESDVIANRIRSIMDPTLLNEDAEDARTQQLAQAVEELQTKLQETELALQIKQDNEQFKNQIEMEKVQNDRKELEIKAAKTMAEIEKLKAEANQEIPAEAAKDMSEAVKNLQEQFEDLHGAVEIILCDAERKKPYDVMSDKGGKNSKDDKPKGKPSKE